jgi:Methylamine utilisation protein MauE
LARFALAGALLVAALAKLADRSGSRESIIAFGAPERAAAPLSWLLIGSELAIAAALLIGRWRVAGAVATLGLLAAFSVVVAVALARGRTPACNCFGRLSGGPVGWSTVARNALLGAMAGFVALGGRESVVFAALAAGSCAVWLGSALSDIACALCVPHLACR